MNWLFWLSQSTFHQFDIYWTNTLITAATYAASKSFQIKTVATRWFY